MPRCICVCINSGYLFNCIPSFSLSMSLNSLCKHFKWWHKMLLIWCSSLRAFPIFFPVWVFVWYIKCPSGKIPVRGMNQRVSTFITFDIYHYISYQKVYTNVSPTSTLLKWVLWGPWQLRLLYLKLGLIGKIFWFYNCLNLCYFEVEGFLCLLGISISSLGTFLLKSLPTFPISSLYISHAHFNCLINFIRCIPLN